MMELDFCTQCRHRHCNGRHDVEYLKVGDTACTCGKPYHSVIPMYCPVHTSVWQYNSGWPTTVSVGTTTNTNRLDISSVVL